MEAEAVNHFNCIYKLTSPSGKVYIGQARDFNQRLKTHLKKDSTCKAIHNAIEKYGIDSFTIEILKEDIKPLDLNKWEMYYIDQFNSFNNGYNLTRGGDGVIRPDGHGVRYCSGKYGIPSGTTIYRKIPEIHEKKKKYWKEYYQRPDVKEHRKEYYQKPDVKEKMKEYRQRPDIKEKNREYLKEYLQRPDIKEKMKEYYQKPDIKEKQREYARKYRQNNPEKIKESKNKYREKQKAIKKALKQNNGQMPLSAYL